MSNLSTHGQVFTDDTDFIKKPNGNSQMLTWTRKRNHQQKIYFPFYNELKRINSLQRYSLPIHPSGFKPVFYRKLFEKYDSKDSRDLKRLS